MLITIKKSGLIALLCILNSIALLSVSCFTGTPWQPDVKIYTYPSQPNPAAAPGQQAAPPVTAQKEEYFERYVVIEQQNNYFPIGVWAGYTERTELVSGNPIDIWFGDVPENLQLEVNGTIIQRSFRWETKIGLKTGVTSVTYKVSNNTTQDYSYSLHMIPSKSGDSVKVTVKQRFIPKQ